MTQHPQTLPGAILNRQLLDGLHAGEQLAIRDDERPSRPLRYLKLNWERGTAFIIDGDRIISRIGLHSPEADARLARYSVAKTH